MVYGCGTDVKCLVCGNDFFHNKKLSEHIKKIHKISPQEYYVKYFHDNVTPSCVVCGGETRYVSLSEGYKKYCHAHQNLAMREAGRVGGRIKTQWNKGKSKENDERLLKLAKRMSGENNPFFGKNHSDEAKRKNADARRLHFSEVLARIADVSQHIRVISDFNDYESQDSPLKIKCDICSTDDLVSFFNIKRCWRCKTCNPVGSRQQLEVSAFVESLGFEVVNSTKKVIPPLELDVWIPAKRIAIEYHGLYWHSGGRNGAFEKNRHKKKYERCAGSDIKLIQIFSDEWILKRDICESIIKNALGVNGIKLNARDCAVEEIDVATAKDFLEKTHISGYTRSRRKYGLFHKTQGLVGVVTTRLPIQKKWGKVIEIARMSFSAGVTVRGGASKLLEHVKKQSLLDGYDGILSYADLRFGTGNVYQKCGMKFMGVTNVNYWYTDGHQRFDRFLYRAQSGKSENDVAAHAGVKAVWGAGNNVFVWLASDKNLSL